MSSPGPRLRRRIFRFASVVLSLVALPIVLLLPAGVLWLWDQGWLLWWLLSGVALTAVAYGLTLLAHKHWQPERRRLEETLDNNQGDGAGTDQSETDFTTAPDAHWNALDRAAWEEVKALAEATDRNILGSQTLLWQRAREVIAAVASHYYPEHDDPIWNFTVPEALLLTERVSQRLRVVLLDHVPAADRLQVGQALRLWRLRSSSMKYYKGAYLTFRLARLINPVGALLAEARERIVSVAWGSTSDYLREKGARIWVEEVGRAAIELYSGRLQANADELADLAGNETAEVVRPGPVRVLVAGQVNVGKSSLINTLIEDSQAAVDLLPMTEHRSAYQLTAEGEAVAVLLDVPGLEKAHTPQWWAERCADVDAVVWVASANRADRQVDRQNLDALREAYRPGGPADQSAAPDRPGGGRTQPSIMVVVSHIDRLSPAREWSPPYDLTARKQPKAIAIADAVEQIADDLAVAGDQVVPVRLDQGPEGYNHDLLWALLESLLDNAKSGRAQRLHGLSGKKQWRRLLAQAKGAGRLIRKRW